MEFKSNSQLSVDWLAFMNSLRAASRIIRAKSRDEAILSFDGTCLHVEFAGGGFTVPAQGYWPSQVRVSAQWLMVMVKMPPKLDPIVFRTVDNRLHLESSSVKCMLQDTWRAAIQVPTNTTAPMLVALSLRYSKEEIEASGLTDRVAKARAELERKIRTATKTLAPYGAEENKLREWVEEMVRNSVDLNRF